MLLPIKLVCKKKKIRKDGTCLIFIQYCLDSDRRTLLSTDIAVPPAFWNQRIGRISPNLPIAYGEVDLINSKLSHLKRKAEDIVEFAIKNKSINPLEFLKSHFAEDFDLSDNKVILNEKPILDIYSEIDLYIKEKEGMVKPSTITVIESMKYHLQAFEEHRNKKITIDSLDNAFYETFVKFLTYDIIQRRRKDVIKGLKINTIGKTIKHFKMFLDNRIKKKLIPYLNLDDWKVLEEEVDAVFLSVEEVSKIYKLDLSNYKHLEKYRDLFIVGCLTGFRFSDYSEIKPEEVQGEMLYVWQKKTNSTVIVPMRNDVKKILIDKYKLQMPQVSNVNFNDSIKEVARLADLNTPIKIMHKRGNTAIEEIKPKFKWVCSHTCRRSFCTNEYLAGMPSDLIMSISGHKTEKAFKKYIKADKLQKAQKVMEYWSKRSDL